MNSSKKIKFCKYQGDKVDDTYVCMSKNAIEKLEESNYTDITRCGYCINDFKIAHYMGNRFEFKLKNCYDFKAIKGLEKILQIVGEFAFEKRKFLMVEDEDRYYLIRDE